MKERRHFGRIPFGTRVEMEAEAGKMEGALVDISLKGAMIKFPVHPPLAQNSPCRLKIVLAADVALEFEAEVVHCQADHAGVHFVRLDIDTFGHLVRLLELNTGNPERIERELRSLAKED